VYKKIGGKEERKRTKEGEHKNLVYGCSSSALLIFVYLMECVTRRRRLGEGGKR